jgi:hypothetical protein
LDSGGIAAYSLDERIILRSLDRVLPNDGPEAYSSFVSLLSKSVTV